MGRLTTMLAVLAAALIAAASASANPRDTTVRTIQDTDGDNLLDYAPGEDHCVFTYLPDADDCVARDLKPRDADSILHFLQLSDFQVVDEESPARVEVLDSTQRVPGASPFSAAYRPQESLTTQVTESMVRQVQQTTSPVTGEPLDLAILTGDNADSQQYNETRWFIDILDGTIGPGNPDPEMEADERPGADRKIVPDSGIESQVPGCTLPPGLEYEDNESVYDGVRDGGRAGQDTGYYDPDESSGSDEDGDGYSPSRERNRAEVPGPHADRTVRDFPGLLEDAQEPFEAVGLGFPWYTAFGNHDALVQGNSGEAFAGPLGPGHALEPQATETVNPAYDAIARGCLKPTKFPGLPEGADGLEDVDLLELLSGSAAEPVVVPPDPRRCFLAKDEPNVAGTPCDTGGWIQQHSRTTGAPLGHGFEPFTTSERSEPPQAGPGRPDVARRNNDGYYSFVPRQGVRFIVLDTITDECGLPVCAEGSVDDPQFRWLEQEIVNARQAGQYVLVFSHHTLRTTRMWSADGSEYPLHHGGKVDPEGRQPAGAQLGDTLEDLYCRHPNVVGAVTGHEHENDVRAHRCEQSPVQANPFVEVTTAAHIDWPQQSRSIELLDEGGRLSLLLTVIDHAAPAKPGGPQPLRIEQGEAGEQPLRLASIGREVAYNDYQHGRGARGDREDRNVIVPMNKLWPPSGSGGGGAPARR